jgi:hypothetical protein
MVSKHLLLLAILFCFGIIMIPQKGYSQCHSLPDLSTLDKDFLTYLDQAAGSKERIAIMPLYDNHVGVPDATFYFGSPFVIYDMFSPQYEGVLHPYLSYAALRELKIGGEDLLETKSLEKISKKLNARYVIFGFFQRSFYDTVRIVINLYDHKTGKKLSKAIEYQSSFNDAVFEYIKQGVVRAFKNSKGGKSLKSPDYSPPTMQAFRYYSKGMAAAAHYQKGKLEVASLWFEKALRESYQRYDDAALNLARVYFMHSLIQKLNKTDSTQTWQGAVRALSYLTAKKQTSFKYLLTTRFLSAQPIMVKAITAHDTQNIKAAGTLAAKGLALVPEDGLLQNLYLQSGVTTKKGIATHNAVCF